MNKQFTFSIRKNGYLQRCSFTAPVESGYVITNNYCPNALIIGEGSMLSQIAIPQNGETENEFIVEALLPSCQKENIHVAVNGQELSIKVKDHKKNHPHSHNYKIRTVTFPMSIDELKIDTRFEHDILEIKLYKKDK